MEGSFKHGMRLLTCTVAVTTRGRCPIQISVWAVTTGCSGGLIMGGSIRAASKGKKRLAKGLVILMPIVGPRTAIKTACR